jgi:spermidine synthase
LVDGRRKVISDRSYLYLTVFAGGMGTLAVEFVASRMLQTVYGTSNLVWANVIGLVLLFLTVGYFLGGRLADSNPSPRVFYTLVTAAGFASILFLLLMSVLLRTAASAFAAVNVGALVSSLVAVIFALAVPITLLGCLSPFAIRLGVRDVAEAGRISGRIYAVSTWGSLFGTYLPVLLVIPLAGSRLAALVFGALVLLVGLGGLWRSGRRDAAVGAVLSLLLLPAVWAWGTGPVKDYPGQIFETESAYNYIQVVRQEECNYLLLNEGQAYHSYYCDEGRVPRISVWSIMLAAPYFNDPAVVAASAPPVQRMAVVGLAAGTIPKQFTRVFGPIAIDGIELDPEIIEVGRDYFAMTEPNLNVIAGDGRYELNRLAGPYDLVTIDAYKVPYIPWHLTTRQFFEEVRDRLDGDGVVAVNVGRAPEDRRLVEAMTATMGAVFPSVHAIDVPRALNTILVATQQPTGAENVRENLALLAGGDPLLVAAVETVAENLVPATASELVFTDERAPLETLVDSLVLRYLLEEGPEGLPGVGG